MLPYSWEEDGASCGAEPGWGSWGTGKALPGRGSRDTVTVGTDLFGRSALSLQGVPKELRAPYPQQGKSGSAGKHPNNEPG